MAKKEKGKSHPNKVYENYKVEGDKLVRQKKTCPKCGPHVFMSQHSNRTVCGTCHYTEFVRA